MAGVFIGTFLLYFGIHFVSMEGAKAIKKHYNENNISVEKNVSEVTK